MGCSESKAEAKPVPEATRVAVIALRTAGNLPFQLISSGDFTQEDCIAAGAIKCMNCAFGLPDARIGDGYTCHEGYSNRKGCGQCGGDPKIKINLGGTRGCGLVWSSVL